MSVHVEKTEDGQFRLTFAEAEVTLSMAEIKALLAGIVGQLAPGAGGGANPAKQLQKLMEKLKTARDVGVETLIRGSSDDDVLVLLKSAEGDADLAEKLYRNMSDRTQKMYREDLTFKFTDGIPKTDLARAAGALSRQAKALEDEGLFSGDG